MKFMPVISAAMSGSVFFLAAVLFCLRFTVHSPFNVNIVPYFYQGVIVIKETTKTTLENNIICGGQHARA
jgi:hypothetical protein